MTGFGEAQLEEESQLYHVELRSVNNRYFKASVRLPDALAFLEPQVDELLRKRLTRGSVTLRVSTRDLSEAAAQDINTLAVKHYLDRLRAIQAGNSGMAIDLATLATLPGVCQPHEMTDAERTRAERAVLKVASEAIEKLTSMRRTEGRALADDLLRHCEAVRTHAEAIRARAPVVVQEYRKRLAARIEQLLAGSGATLGEADLLKEVAIFAERSDVSEELSRLISHLEQFAGSMQAGEPSGRKLEFIAQEMHREANTIGAKACDAEIARHMFEIKSSIDRIKEQVMNVE